MSCSNCFNGCTDIPPDKCVKYTGVPIPELGIDTGDSLLVVENQIIEKVLSMMTGEGIVPIIDPADLCVILNTYLPSSGEINLNDVIHALFKAICAMDTKIIAIQNQLTILNGPYNILCLSGVTPLDNTHVILQAVIKNYVR